MQESTMVPGSGLSKPSLCKLKLSLSNENIAN